MEVRARESFQQELLEVAIKLDIPQALLEAIPGQRLYLVRAGFLGLPGDYHARPQLDGRHCETCDDLIVPPSLVTAYSCPNCGNDICTSCAALVPGAPAVCLICWLPYQHAVNGIPIIDESNVGMLSAPSRAQRVLRLRAAYLNSQTMQGLPLRRSLDTLSGFPYCFLGCETGAISA